MRLCHASITALIKKTFLTAVTVWMRSQAKIKKGEERSQCGGAKNMLDVLAPTGHAPQGRFSEVSSCDRNINTQT